MFLKIGTISKTHGLKGEVKVYSSTSFAKQRYKKGNKVYIEDNGEYKEFTVRSFHNIDPLFDCVAFEELPTINDVEKYLKKDLYAVKEEMNLSKSTFFYCDLENCSIIDSKNNVVGIVVKVEEFPAQLTLKCKKISSDSDFFYVPFIDYFIKNVDISEKKITIKEIEGLLWNSKS